MWAVATREDADRLRDWAEYFAIDLPILDDADGTVSALYQGTMSFPTGAYPQQWLIGTDGVIEYYANEYYHDALVEVIERELAER